MQEKYIIPSTEDDPIPQKTGDGASSENQTTIFSESSRAEFVRDKETVCQKFSCSLEEDQICRNELGKLLPVRGKSVRRQGGIPVSCIEIYFFSEWGFLHILGSIIYL